MALFTGPINSLGMPRMWQKWFDALRSQGVTGLADQSVGVKKGILPASIQGLRTSFGPQAPELPSAGETEEDMMRPRAFNPGWTHTRRGF